MSDADFARISSGSGDYSQGTIKLFTFAHWENSAAGVDAVQWLRNHIDPAERHRYYRASPRTDAYATAKQSAQFMIFLMSFIAVLFFAVADITVFFKIQAEAEDGQRVLNGLYRIGVAPGEMLDMIRLKNAAYFMPQAILEPALGAFLNFTIHRFYGFRWKAALLGLPIGIGVSDIAESGCGKEFRSGTAWLRLLRRSQAVRAIFLKVLAKQRRHSCRL